MAHVTGDRILELSITTGTGNITLAGAVAGYRAFSVVATVNADTFFYAIFDTGGGTAWEVGLGTRASATTFARTTVLASSNAGALVNFTGVGPREVWIDLPASKATFGMNGWVGNFTGNTSGVSNLGTTALPWGDLHLKSGGTINFNAGDFTLTHAANLLTLAGGAVVIEGLTRIGTGSTSTAALALLSNESTALDATAADGQVGLGNTLHLINVAGNNNDFCQILFQNRTSSQSYSRIIGGHSTGPDSYLAFITGDNGVYAERMRLSPSGALSVTGGITGSSPTAGIGYATGAGGTVTQPTSKATGVPLNTVCGAITMNNAALAAGVIVSFVFTNTAIAATDTLGLSHQSGGTMGSYTLNARCAAGSATIDVRNNTAGSLSEAIVIKFHLHKGVNA